MKTLFSFSNYKTYLHARIHSPDSPRGLQTKLAKHLGCQAAYIYQILKGKGELTEDQAFKTTTFFEFGKSEQEYFILLVRLEKAVSPELREYLKLKIKEKLKEDLDLKNKTNSSAPHPNDEAWDFYFSSSTVANIHLLTSSEKFRTAESLAKKLNLPVKQVNATLSQLLQYGFVTSKNNKWTYASPSVHFSKSSRHNLVLQVMRREQALASILKNRSDDTHFSSLFTLDRESLKELQTQISDFVQKAQTTIHRGGTDELYALCLDLFCLFPEEGSKTP